MVVIESSQRKIKIPICSGVLEWACAVAKPVTSSIAASLSAGIAIQVWLRARVLLKTCRVFVGGGGVAMLASTCAGQRGKLTTCCLDVAAVSCFQLCWVIMFRVANTAVKRTWVACRAPVHRVVARTMATEAEEAAATFGDDEIMLNLALPHGSLVKAACKRVTVPGRGGVYGIQRNSPPMLSELKPGVVLVDYGRDEPERFIVAGGFAFTHEDGIVEVSVPEGVRVEDIDADLVRQKTDELRTIADGAADGSKEQAEANIGLEVYKAIGYELGI